MNNLKLFNSNEFGGMRTYCDPNTGDVWFCLADVCKALDIKNLGNVKATLTSKGLISLNKRELDNNIHSMDVIHTEDLDNTVGSSDGIPTEDLENTVSQTDGNNRGNPNMTFIDEGNLYQVIFQSRKPNAAKFKEWVCYEVLPTIRRTGMYATSDLLDNPDLAIEIFQQLKIEREEKKRLQATINENKPKVDYADAILESDGSILIKEMALWLQKNGIKIGQLKLYEWMRENGYTYKEGEMKNLPQQKWIEKGYFTLKKSRYFKDNEAKTSTTAKITEKGQQYFLEVFKKIA